MLTEIPLSAVWLVLVIVFAVAEAATVGLVAIWFSFGALLAMLAALLHLSLAVQLVLFLAGSVLTLWLLREYSRKSFSRRKEKTNFDRIVSMEGMVTEAIDNARDVGQVRVGGQIWSARSQDGMPVSVGEKVVVLAISGVKVIVACKQAD